jgi:hypothetical protein
MDVCRECCVLSGRGLCDELITRPEESYGLWRIIVCDLENLFNEEVMVRVGLQRQIKKKHTFYAGSKKARTFRLTIISHHQA